MTVEPDLEKKKKTRGNPQNLTKAGHGRPKGSRNKVYGNVVREIAAKQSYDPLVELMKIAKTHPTRAEEIAWRLMPYFYRELPVEDREDGSAKSLTLRLDLG
jgi:hypothetical protein